ncbi:MAG: phosphatidate cytidylyltransferase [Clostridium sp.]|nr:MAG: phosphatidate cytidylyltransferase [Clostridium sp.]
MRKRVISAIIALIICIPLLIVGGYPFYIGVSILSVIGYYEIINIRERERKVPLLIKLIGLVTYLMIVLNNVVGSNIFYIDYKVLALASFTLMLPIIFFDRKKYNVNDALYLIGTSIFF